jgi:hypothetical protein
MISSPCPYGPAGEVLPTSLVDAGLIRAGIHIHGDFFFAILIRLVENTTHNIKHIA